MLASNISSPNFSEAFNQEHQAHDTGSFLPDSVRTNDKTAKTALVAEGGGQRGIFTAGVLDTWLEHSFDPFDILIGTSAGSQNLTSFVARQKGYAKRLIRGLTRHKRFFQLSRGLLGKHIVDLDWYFDKTQETKRKLDFDTAKQNVHGREILFTATNIRDRKAYLLNPLTHTNQWLDLIKASSALPFLYKQGVPLRSIHANNSHVDGETEAANTDYYADGGLAAPLPVIEAYERGAKKIVVIRTVDKSFDAQSIWLQRLRGIVCSTGQCPKTIDYMLQHEEAYRKALDFIANPPDDVEIVQIFASAAMQSKLLGSTDVELKHDYRLGQQAGHAFLEEQTLLPVQTYNQLTQSAHPAALDSTAGQTPAENTSLPIACNQ